MPPEMKSLAASGFNTISPSYNFIHDPRVYTTNRKKVNTQLYSSGKISYSNIRRRIYTPQYKSMDI